MALLSRLFARELPLIDQPPRPGRLAGAHVAGRFQDLPVGEEVPVPGEVLGQVVGGLGDPRAHDEAEPGVLQRVQIRGREHSGVRDHDQVGDVVTLGERGQHGDEGGGLSLVPLEDVHLQGEPTRIDQEPDLDLRVDSVLLAHRRPGAGRLPRRSRSAGS